MVTDVEVVVVVVMVVVEVVVGGSVVVGGGSVGGGSVGGVPWAGAATAPPVEAISSTTRTADATATSAAGGRRLVGRTDGALHKVRDRTRFPTFTSLAQKRRRCGTTPRRVLHLKPSCCVTPADLSGTLCLMQIGTILQTKGSDVLVVTGTATVLEASRLLASGGVGALVVSADGSSIDGIVSERDIARVVAHRGADGLSAAVESVMTREVTTCSLDDTIDHLMAVMTDRRVRHLPVVVDGALAGIVSIGDVVKHRLDELETETKTLHDYITTGR